MITDDPYAILGVARNCDGDLLKSAYRRLVRENHPDMASDKVSATHRMTQINAAWALLGDPQKRADFDLRQRFEERQRRERFAPRAVPASSRTSAPGSSAPSRSSSSRAASSNGDKNASSARPAPANTRHARLAEASRLLFKQNRPAEALELCRAILKTDFRNIPARELMGEAYLRLGELERALAVWEQALVLSPGNAPLRRRWMQLMSPDVRSQPFSPNRPIPVPVQSLPAKTSTRKKKSPGLFSRLFSRLKKR